MEPIGPIKWPIQVCDSDTEYFDLYYVEIDGGRHVVGTLGDLDDGPVPLRIESACIFGHVFRGVHCDCGEQWEQALANIIDRGRGMVIYSIDDDARGHGIEMHFQLYVYRQHEGRKDEREIFDDLGKEMDVRDYDYVAEILEEFSVDEVELMTNNPERVEFLEENGFTVVDRIGLEADITEFNQELLLQEKEWMQYETSYKTHETWRELFEEEYGNQPGDHYLVTADHQSVVDEGRLDSFSADRLPSEDAYLTMYVDATPPSDLEASATEVVDQLIVHELESSPIES